MTSTSTPRYVSDLADATLADLEEAGAVALDGEAVAPATLGRVAAYYYLDYRTTRDAADAVDDVDDACDGSLTDEARAVGLLCDAREFAELPVRHNEDGLNADLAAALFLPDERPVVDGVRRISCSSLLQHTFDDRVSAS